MEATAVRLSFRPAELHLRVESTYLDYLSEPLLEKMLENSVGLHVIYYIARDLLIQKLNRKYIQKLCGSFDISMKLLEPISKSDFC